MRPREHVGLLLPTSVEFVECLFAIALAGAVAVPLNARYKHNELSYAIENGDLVTLITTDRVAEQVNFAERLEMALPGLSAAADAAQLFLKATPRLRNLVLLGKTQRPGFLTEAEFLRRAAQVPEDAVHASRLAVRLRDVAIMLYTSGTTANPKGCLLTHEAMVRNSISLGRNRYALKHEDVFWSPLPMFHIAAILPMCAIFDVGGAYATMGHFEAGAALGHAGRREGHGHLSLLRHHHVGPDPPQGLREHGSVAHHPHEFQLRGAAAGDRQRDAQGDAAGDLCRHLRHDRDRRHGEHEPPGGPAGGAHRAPRAARCRGSRCASWTRPPARTQPRGGHGEVLVRGYSILEGYYKDPVKTAAAIDPAGWYHTGDIGSIDAAGTMMFHGRLKDMLKVGGENVAAAEIESCLQRHPGVKLAQVVGIPDARLGEVPAAFIERAAGTEVPAQELMDFCRREIASFKVPRQVRFVSEWPMWASKIQKFRLRDELVRELGL